MTYSIIARDTRSGEIGIAVASRYFAVGAIVPDVSHLSAVATQAHINPLWGMEGLRRLDGGESPRHILADLQARDAGQATRQAHLLAPGGAMAQHTGADCVPWCGHLAGLDVSVAGNMPVGPAVVERTLQAFLDNAQLPLAERLLAAMQAGDAAGCDKRWRQSAALRVHAGMPFPALDIRVDDHAEPLTELRRLLSVCKEQLEVRMQFMPTVDSFSGCVDNRAIEEAKAVEAARRKAAGIASQSYASAPTSEK